MPGRPPATGRRRTAPRLTRPGCLHPAADAAGHTAERSADTGHTADLPSGWSFHELLAYDGARAGPRDRLYGPVFPLRDTEPPPPPVIRPPTGRTIPLRHPDPDPGQAARADRKRLSWKYAAHSYALTLKNTGVLLQTLSLVATAMGLSGCALGGGDSGTPARAFGLAAHTEIPVGAFLLGSAPADGPGHAPPPAGARPR
ncbi:MULTISPECIES: nitroreductase family protein [unclassified Streptomyces]|uniref:nitroreductase family protein n=1 Tax=unclassified Streptomyces TaxID=2593676 RepID=UPI00336ADCD9